MSDLSTAPSPLDHGPDSPILALGRAGTAHSIDLQIVEDLCVAEEIWRGLETKCAPTPFQTFDWHRIETASAERNFRTVIVIGRNMAGTPVLLVPLALEHHGPFRALTWLSGSQASYPGGLFHRDLASCLTANDMSALTARIGRLVPDAQALVLLNQRDDDEFCPFGLLPRVDGAGTGHAITLCPWDQLYAARGNRRTRHNDRRREKRLGELAPWHVEFAQAPSERRRLMDILIAQKSVWLRERGIDDFLAEPSTRSLLMDLATSPPSSAMHAEVAALQVGDETAAVSVGLTQDKNHYLLMTSVHPEATFRSCTPGDILFRQVLKSLCGRNIETVDLGIGTTPQKEHYADRQFRLFHTLVPLTQAGRLHVAALRARLAAKRWIKDDPKLWNLFQRYRRARGMLVNGAKTSAS